MINSPLPSPAPTPVAPRRFRAPRPARAAPVLAALVVVTSACSFSDPLPTALPEVTVTTTATTTVTREVTTTAAPTESTTPAAAAAPQPAADVGAGQRNAARSAQQYLAISGFSRSGLIEQLQYEGYSADQAAFGASAAGL